MERSEEVRHKVSRIREALGKAGLGGVRLRGTDWFTWVTAGADATVLLAAEKGVAEVLVTGGGAYVLTDEIERDRLADEELTRDFELLVNPWADSAWRERAVRERLDGRPCASDSPVGGESHLPPELVRSKRILLPSEVARYRTVGRLASEAMTQTLLAARPHWTEHDLAGAGASALWERGIHPALTLVAGERRLPVYRHATASREPLGRRAMLVFCARGYGLYANLTRFVSFDSPSGDDARRHATVREVEADVLDASVPGADLAGIYGVLERAYGGRGAAQAMKEHHQGGTTGYLAREVVATPTTNGETLAAGTAVAWNPSVRGAKIEDTFVVGEGGRLENLTLDPAWPCIEVRGRARPVPLVRA